MTKSVLCSLFAFGLSYSTCFAHAANVLPADLTSSLCKLALGQNDKEQTIIVNSIGQFSSIEQPSKPDESFDQLRNDDFSMMRYYPWANEILRDAPSVKELAWRVRRMHLPPRELSQLLGSEASYLFTTITKQRKQKEVSKVAIALEFTLAPASRVVRSTVAII